jgi:hypothetical protein
MEITTKIDAFSRMGELMAEVTGRNSPDLEDENIAMAFNDLRTKITECPNHNPWFTEDNVNFSITAWSEALARDKTEKWFLHYGQKIIKPRESLNIGVVMAGNIPMVGFHDLLCVLASGNKIQAKLSSQDNVLIPAVVRLLEAIEPGFRQLIEIQEGPLKNFDAIIATGSNNTSRYFEYYFGKHPHIIRKNRNSVAILTGDETREDLEALSNDIFLYFGLGCRNISKIYIPDGYSFTDFFEAIRPFAHVGNQNKYRNNYDYQKSILLVNRIPFEDNGFLILKKDKSFISPVSVLNYEIYKDLGELDRILSEAKDSIQCVVSNSPAVNGSIRPGQSQRPTLWDYADNIDTMEFLFNL